MPPPPPTPLSACVRAREARRIEVCRDPASFGQGSSVCNWGPSHGPRRRGGVEARSHRFWRLLEARDAGQRLLAPLTTQNLLWQCLSKWRLVCAPRCAPRPRAACSVQVRCAHWHSAPARRTPRTIAASFISSHAPSAVIGAPRKAASLVTSSGLDRSDSVWHSRECIPLPVCNLSPARMQFKLRYKHGLRNCDASLIL